MEQQGENMAANVGGVNWQPAMSTFVLTYLAQLVANGTKTSTGFKQVHYNACAKALNEHMGTQYTGIQVSNHLRKWKKGYGKILKLKNLSGALWDEEACMISLANEHYINHIRDYRDDAKYLNTPIEHYHEIATIFGNNLATGVYAKGASDPLATEVTETANAPNDTEDVTTPTNGGVGVDEATISINNIGESSCVKPPPAKKLKVVIVEDPSMVMVSMMSENLGNIATSITALSKVVAVDDDIPDELYDDLMSVPTFKAAHLDHYYAYLCDNPRQARRFYKLPSLSSKMI